VPSRTVGTVLMIDDNEVLRSAASKLLRTQGFRELEADFGAMPATSLVFSLCITTPHISPHQLSFGQINSSIGSAPA
jgi:hypothetical protein